MTATKNVNEHNEKVNARITPGLIAEYLESLIDDIPETLTVREAIDRLTEWDEDNQKRSVHTEYMDVYADIDFDVDIDFDDVEAYVEDSTKNADEVFDLFDERVEEDLDTPDNLYDELKWQICLKAMEKYSLDQLERRLGIDWT